MNEVSSIRMRKALTKRRRFERDWLSDPLAQGIPDDVCPSNEIPEVAEKVESGSRGQRVDRIDDVKVRSEKMGNLTDRWLTPSRVPIYCPHLADSTETRPSFGPSAAIMTECPHLHSKHQ